MPDPRSPNFEEEFRLDLLTICKRILFHHCTRTCKKYNHGLHKLCRFDFPRELVDPPGIIFPEQGIIAIQRTSAFINNHNPYITAA
ncbi:13660_t:CDS:1, partial [Ambispora leptoticha]